MNLNDIDSSMHLEQLKNILRAYHDRIKGLEDKKYDVEYIVKRKDVEVQSHAHTHKKKPTIIQNITKLKPNIAVAPIAFADFL